MRKVLWYRSSIKKDKGVSVPDWRKPIYYTGPWWAFFIRGLLWDWGSTFIDWASSIEGKYLEPEEGKEDEMDKWKN